MGKARSVRTTERGLLPMLRLALSRLPFTRARRKRGITVKKWRLIAGVALIGALAGVIELGLPFDDFHRALRAELRQTKADGSIVVVEVDDKTLNALGTRSISRAIESKAVDKLLGAGVERVFFDRAHADLTNSQDDAIFRAMLQRSKGRVYLGSSPEIETGFQSHSAILPAPQFREYANVASMVAMKHPFSLSVSLPYSTEIDGQSQKSISAALADEAGQGWYRPDFGIDVASIPSASMIDVLNDEYPREALDGRDVIIAYTSIFSRDFHHLPLGERLSGSYIHVLGAQTLKRGLATDLGWLPLFVGSVLGLVIVTVGKRSSRHLMVGLFGFVILAPFVLDHAQISVDVFPALLVLSVGMPVLTFRIRKLYDHSTGLLRLTALQSVPVDNDTHAFALKVRNFSSIAATLSNVQMRELLNHIVHRIAATESTSNVAFEKDTFVWFRPDLREVELANHARGIQALFLSGIPLSTTSVDLAVAIGIDAATGANARERIEDAIQAAEEAAHNRVVMTQAREIDAEQRWLQLRTLTDLDEAMAEDAVGIAYQPKVNLRTGEWVGAEALLRWTHAERGEMDPASVVAMAEEHNRIDRLTLYILRHSAKVALAAEYRALDFKIAVNVSAVSLRSPNFIEMLRTFVNDASVDVRRLVIEITETSRLQGEACSESLAQLTDLGFELSIDDFGIGMATVDYLKRIPSREVKIDRSFIGNMRVNCDDRVLVGSMIEMIHSLGRRAVAEGVEDIETLSILEALGCDLGQGYLFARPLTAEKLIANSQDSRKLA